MVVGGDGEEQDERGAQCYGQRVLGLGADAGKHRAPPGLDAVMLGGILELVGQVAGDCSRCGVRAAPW